MSALISLTYLVEQLDILSWLEPQFLLTLSSINKSWNRLLSSNTYIWKEFNGIILSKVPPINCAVFDKLINVTSLTIAIKPPQIDLDNVDSFEKLYQAYNVSQIATICYFIINSPLANRIKHLSLSQTFTTEFVSSFTDSKFEVISHEVISNDRYIEHGFLLLNDMLWIYPENEFLSDIYDNNYQDIVNRGWFYDFDNHNVNFFNWILQYCKSLTSLDLGSFVINTSVQDLMMSEPTNLDNLTIHNITLMDFSHHTIFDKQQKNAHLLVNTMTTTLFILFGFQETPSYRYLDISHDQLVYCLMKSYPYQSEQVTIRCMPFDKQVSQETIAQFEDRCNYNLQHLVMNGHCFDWQFLAFIVLGIPSLRIISLKGCCKINGTPYKQIELQTIVERFSSQVELVF